VEWLRERGVDAIHAHESALKQRLWEALWVIPGVAMQSPMHGEDGAGIVTITIDGVDPADAALRLDRDSGVLVRAGLHCAPESHILLGTERTGAIRFSVGWATTAAEVDRAAAAVARVAETKGSGRG
jgi:cysteine desulfurase/selenocysteine lyase